MKTKPDSPLDPSQARSISDARSMSTLFYRDTRLTMLIVAVAVVAGLTSLFVLPRMEDPVLSERYAVVTTRLPGADARRVETLVTEELEDRLQNVEEINRLTSESRPGISSIVIELRDEITETDKVWSEVRGKIDDAQTALPPDAGEPIFEELKVRATALIVALKWTSETKPNWSILRRLAKQLEERLQAIRGTEAVDRFADPGEEITVTLDPDRAAAIGLNASDVARQLRASDAKSAAGLLRMEDRELVMEVDNQFRQSDRIGDTLVQSSQDARWTRLRDVSTIDRVVPDPKPRYALVDSRPSVVVGTLVRPSYRIDRWQADAQTVLDEFEDELPSGVDLTVVLEQNQYVENRLRSLIGSLLLGITAVTAVMFLLMGWRSALIVAIALPLSGLTVLFGLRILEIPLHQMSITGIIIALGLLIDNAIVAVDEVNSEMRDGTSALDAVGKTVRHLAMPLTGSTITTALAFAPIAIMEGAGGEFVGSIAVSVMLAVFASLGFSLSVIPVLAARFAAPRRIKSDPMSDRRKPWIYHVWNGLRATATSGISSRSVVGSYRRLLEFMFRRPVRGIAVSVAMPIIGFWMFTQLPEQFFPPADRDQFHIEVELPVDASIAATEATVREINEELEAIDAKRVSWFLGESAPRFYYNINTARRGMPFFANAIVQMDSAKHLRPTLWRLQERLDTICPEARVVVRQLEQGPPFDAPIELRLFGPDLDTLQALGDELRVLLAQVPDVLHTKSLMSETLPTVTLDIREDEARLAGMAPTDISRQLFDQLEGAFAGEILEDTERVPVRVRVGNARRSRLSEIESMELVSPSGKRPLSSLASVQLKPETAVVTRMDRRRMNLIAGYVRAGTLPAKSLSDFKRRMVESGIEFPPGYDLKYGGEAAQRDQAVGNLMANVGVLAMLMIATLVISFRSFRMTGLIFVVAVCSVGLGMVGLYVLGYPFGFMAIIGTMGLIGIAINDSIVVLAALQAATRENQISQRSGKTGSALSVQQTTNVVVRCTRHVLATTMTTIAGFTPLILNGSEFWPPLAIAIAGGVTGATILALLLIPCGFRLLTVREKNDLDETSKLDPSGEIELETSVPVAASA